MIFRPDIKPPMWGPLDEVRYAVQANAERLGIDPATLLSIHPLWSGAGDILDSLGSASAGSRNTATWTADGLITGSGNGLTATTTLTNPFARQHTILSVITLNQNRKQGFYQRRETFGGAGLVVGQFDTGGVVRAYAGASSVSQRSVFVPTVGKQFASCVVVDLNLANADRVKMFFNGALDASTASGTHTTSSLATYESEIGYASSFAGFSWLRMDGVFHFYADFDGAISNDAACALTATPYALLMPVSRPVYFDLGATSGGTLTTDSAWKIYTAAEINTAWSIRATLSQAAAWAVFTRADADSAWSIRTSADTTAEWSIKAGLDTATAWPIFTAADTETAWRILEGLALDTPTAWSIKTALAAEAAWSIRNALDTGTAWAILSRLDRETAWQILGAGILDTPTAWAIRADLDQATAWTIKTSLDAETDWTIINGMVTATAWDILQGFATDTAWQLFNGLDTATAWSIISDMVPEPVRVFMAEPRDFIINAEKRIFILLAERK